jgi:Tfp pilus assembly protein PilF
MTSRVQLASILCLVLMAPISLLAQFERDDPRDLGREEPRSFEDTGPAPIRGQVIADQPARLDHPIPVRLESLGRIMDTVFTDGNGNFVFDNVRPGNVFYVVIDERGFRPVRERAELGTLTITSGGLPILVFLESEGTEDDSTDNASNDSGAVDLRQLTSDIPREAIEAFQKAAEESQKDNNERAAQHLEEAVEIAPDFYEAQNALGVEYQKLGRLDDAISRFQIAMELNPNAVEPALSLGVHYLQDSDLQIASSKPEEGQESLEKAFGYLETAVERDTTSASAQYYFGTVLYKTGANEEALIRLDRALALDQRLHAIHLMLFNVYLAERDYLAALNELETYLLEYPESPQREAVERIVMDLQQQLSSP